MTRSTSSSAFRAKCALIAEAATAEFDLPCASVLARIIRRPAVETAARVTDGVDKDADVEPILAALTLELARYVNWVTDRRKLFLWDSDLPEGTISVRFIRSVIASLGFRWTVSEVEESLAARKGHPGLSKFRLLRSERHEVTAWRACKMPTDADASRLGWAP